MKNSFSLKIFIIYNLIFLLTCFFSLTFGAVSLSNFSIQNIFYGEDILLFKILSLRANGLAQAILVGCILALSGAVLQKLLRNPLADPYILGISSGGACFLSISIVFQLSQFFSLTFIEEYFPVESFFAFIGCFFSIFILLFFRKKIPFKNDEYIYPVLGIILNSFFSSILLMIISVAKPEQVVQVQYALIGNFQSISNKYLLLFYLTSLLPILFLINKSKYFDYLLYGDEFSKSLGINSVRLRKICIFLVCVLISVVVSTAGAIGFIGLIVPHMIRKMHRVSSLFECYLCMILGAIVLINADTLSRTLFSPAQLPVGIFTASLGSPVLAFILLRKRAH